MGLTAKTSCDVGRMGSRMCVLSFSATYRVVMMMFMEFDRIVMRVITMRQA